jgi:hypothetical protein
MDVDSLLTADFLAADGIVDFLTGDFDIAFFF